MAADWKLEGDHGRAEGRNHRCTRKGGITTVVEALVIGRRDRI